MILGSSFHLLRFLAIVLVFSVTPGWLAGCRGLWPSATLHFNQHFFSGSSILHMDKLVRDALEHDSRFPTPELLPWAALTQHVWLCWLVFNKTRSRYLLQRPLFTLYLSPFSSNQSSKTLRPWKPVALGSLSSSLILFGSPHK